MYQDGAAVVLLDKEGVFGIHACTYHKEKELVCPPANMLAKEVWEEGGPVGGGLCGCSVGWMVAWLGWLALECWRCLKKYVPNMWKLVFSNVPVERGVLYPDEHGFLNGSRLAVDFLVNYAELVGIHGMACGGTVEVYRGKGLEVFLYSVS